MQAMTRNRTLIITFTLTLVMSSLALLPAASPQQQKQYVPQVGQAGKDVIWVPTPEETIAAMLDMAKVTPNDYVIDLGSGDGRIVIAAAKRGARALGIEYNLDMVELSRSNAQKEGVTAKATFEHGDIFERDFSEATVLTMYLLPDLNMKLRPKILEMKPGTRVVTNSFTMDDWEPDQTTSAGDRTVYFWIVPAKVAGTWAWTGTSGSAELTLKQSFQKIEGSLKINGKELPLKNVKLEGANISFSAGDSTVQQFQGAVSGNSIQGTIKAGNSPATKWAATRR
jgi:SAM-dependent methyltransferase